MKFPEKIPFTLDNVMTVVKAAILRKELIWYIHYSSFGSAFVEPNITYKLGIYRDNIMIDDGSIIFDDYPIEIKWIYADRLKQMEMYLAHSENYEMPTKTSRSFAFTVGGGGGGITVSV